jgi:integrase/recombinase XerD
VLEDQSFERFSMPAKSRVWWWSAKQYWATQIDGRRVCLAKGRKNKKAAEDKLDAMLAERALLSTVGGEISVAGLCEEFLSDAERQLAPKTYESYRYSCQQFIDQFGLRAAHTIKPADIRKFSLLLEKRLNATSQAIVLRSVQRCFNWGVEEQVIPAHEIGRVRKPAGNRRDRFVTDEEFQAMLRGTNPKNGHRRGAEFRRLLLAMDWTLCRPGEVARLQWADIHWDQSVAILAQHKTQRATNKPKVIALVPKMKRLLKWLLRQSTSLNCFVNSRGEPWTVNAVDQRMQHLRERAGLGNDVIPYTLRHRAATNAILRTGNLKLTSQLLGHTSTATTERYTHVAQEHLVKFAEAAVG